MHKVLVIDDSPAIHALVRARLAGEGVEIVEAPDGETGIELARGLKPDLILLDVEMPSPDGFEVCRALKAEHGTMHIPVIFLTGVASTEQKTQGLDLGAVDYIVKPFDPAELRARVRAALRTRRLIELLANKARIDALTGLHNREHLDRRLAAELAESRRTGAPLSCVMADVDHFKRINDMLGHVTGDEVLRLVAETLSAKCGAKDVLCRYGGEEFAILLPGRDAREAAEVAEGLRAAVAGLSQKVNGHSVSITCSFGVAELSDPPPPSVIEIADAALYRAKQAGRNRVEVGRAGSAPAGRAA